jgi:hypothetical protein
LKKQLAICAGLWLLGLGTSGTAAAQPIYAGAELSDPVLPPYEIVSIVRSTGLAPLTRPMRRGPYYVLVAVDRVGRQMRVVVDAQLGDIVNLRPALALGSYGPEVGRPVGVPGAGAPPSDSGGAAGYGSRPSGDIALAPTPPRPIPNVRAVSPAGPVSPPTRVAVAEPALPPSPPLPRPRPKLALNEAPAQPPAAAPPAVQSPAPPAATPSAAPSGADETAKQIE